MKITKSYLKQIILEEINSLKETNNDPHQEIGGYLKSIIRNIEYAEFNNAVQNIENNFKNKQYDEMLKQLDELYPLIVNKGYEGKTDIIYNNIFLIKQILGK